MKKKFRIGTFLESTKGCTNSHVRNIVRDDNFVERGRRPHNGANHCCMCGVGAYVEQQDYDEDDIEDEEEEDVIEEEVDIEE